MARSFCVNAKSAAAKAHNPARGGDRKSEQAKGENQADNVSLKTQHGNQKFYLLARLDRDRPELAQRVRQGEQLRKYCLNRGGG
jgi:hypothetical protein